MREFLSGRSDEVQTRLQARDAATPARELDFERAAVLRDRLKAMAHIQARQGINTDAVDDADVIAAHHEGGQVCVQVFFYRSGRNYGNRAYYPAHTKDAEPGEILAAFLGPVLRRAGAGTAGAAGRAGGRSRTLLAEALAVRAGRKVRARWCRSAASGASWSRSR